MITNEVNEYLKDGRLSIDDMYRMHDNLMEKYGFDKDVVFVEELILSDNTIKKLPMNTYHTKEKGPALWLMAGVHGEEPAGSNALIQKIDEIGVLANKGVPLVVLPMCNPKGYFRDWRYPDQEKYKENVLGKSVGDSEHWLSDDPQNPQKPRAIEPSCWQAEALTRSIVLLSKDFPPILSLDLHEDDLLEAGYIYSQGMLSQNDPVAKKIVQIFDGQNYPLFKSGMTRFGQNIKDGIVERDYDGSIDELLAAEKIYSDGNLIDGPAARSVIVIETSAHNRKLDERVQMHNAILDRLEDLWEIANSKV